MLLIYCLFKAWHNPILYATICYWESCHTLTRYNIIDKLDVHLSPAFFEEQWNKLVSQNNISWNFVVLTLLRNILFSSNHKYSIDLKSVFYQPLSILQLNLSFLDCMWKILCWVINDFSTNNLVFVCLLTSNDTFSFLVIICSWTLFIQIIK